MRKYVVRLTQRLDAYDPYGFYRVNGLQCITMVVILFSVQRIFNIPEFKTAMNLPLFGLMMIGLFSGYNNRLKALAIFFTAAIIYTVILNVVHQYRSLTVFAVGVMVSIAFSLSKKRIPQLLSMVSVLQAAVYTSFVSPFGGDWYAITRYMVTLGAVAIFSFVLFALFPRIYFFRIWLRSLYLTLGEFEEKFSMINSPGYSSPQLLFKHLIRLHDFTDSLGYKEYGFAARRITVNLVSIYTITVALVNNVIHFNNDELSEVRIVCHKLRHALVNNIQLEEVVFLPSCNKYLLDLHADLRNIICVWNKLCLKI